jgi:hypothetical protein
MDETKVIGARRMCASKARVVASLRGAFVENWLEATGNVLGGEPYFPQLSRRGSVVAQAE